jgi:hypothetical protein
MAHKLSPCRGRIHLHTLERKEEPRLFGATFKQAIREGKPWVLRADVTDCFNLQHELGPSQA